MWNVTLILGACTVLMEREEAVVEEKSTNLWPARAADLIRWFELQQSAFPMIPYRLDPWTYVADPPLFYAALGRDIASGPHSPRAYPLVDDLEEIFAWWTLQREKGD